MNNNFSSSPFVTAAPAPSAPPPPTEVKVRTMRSDLASMAKSGGGLPRFEDVKVTGLSFEKKAIGQAVAVKAEGVKKNWIFLAIAFAVIAVVGVLVYAAYRFFFVQGPSVGQPREQTAPQTNAQTTASPAAQPPAPAPAVSFTHTSFFKKPADQVLTLTLAEGGAASNAVDLQTFNQKLETLLSGVSKNANLIEVEVKDTKGHSMGVGDILLRANAAVLDPQFLTAHFNPDATFFVYRDKNGFWPGYVLSLRPTENWLFLKSDIAKLEVSPNIVNFFLGDPGKPSEDGFTDSAIAGTAIRVLPFLEAKVPTYFAYGWNGNYLIMSTSQGGFGQAVGRL